MTTRLPPGSRRKLAPGIVVPDDDAPDDIEPLPDAMNQLPHFIQTIEIIKTVLRGLAAALVSGDTPIYYDEDGEQKIVRPDCYVVFDVDVEAIMRRNGYFIREVGKPPDFALEIASESTFPQDMGPKRDLYARLGIREYWRFDATGDKYYGEPLVGEVLVDGQYRRIHMERNDAGLVWGRSEALGLDLCWDDGRLRFYDPATGEYQLNMTELVDAVDERDRIIAEREQTIAGMERALAERNRALAERNRELREAERSIEEERAARRSAEAALELERDRIRQYEEELRRRQES